MKKMKKNKTSIDAFKNAFAQKAKGQIDLKNML
jgi:hypothetical protein